MNPSATRYIYQTVRWLTHIGTVAAAVYFVLLTIQVFFWGQPSRSTPPLENLDMDSGGRHSKRPRRRSSMDTRSGSAQVAGRGPVTRRLLGTPSISPALVSRRHAGFSPPCNEDTLLLFAGDSSVPFA